MERPVEGTSEKVFSSGCSMRCQVAVGGAGRGFHPIQRTWGRRAYGVPWCRVPGGSFVADARFSIEVTE
jgi:hypothetical protein